MKIILTRGIRYLGLLGDEIVYVARIEKATDFSHLELYEFAKLKEELEEREECRLDMHFVKKGEQLKEEKKDRTIRAIYVEDMKFDNCPVFELDKDSSNFVMIMDEDFHYPIEQVLSEDNWTFSTVEKIGEDIVIKKINKIELLTILKG